jgi:Flp pilus assembly protein TadD
LCPKAEEAPITPTCRLRLAALAAGAALFLPLAGALASVEDQKALAAYARARAADSFGAHDRAAEGYATALSLAPANEVLASRALSRAIAAGDRPLALRAARVLDAAGKLAPDGRLLLLAESLRTKDWKAARLHIDRIEEDEVFAFMAPVLRAWLAFGSGKGDPLAPLEGLADNPLAAGYAAEHRPLIFLARGQHKQGLAALAPLLEPEDARAQRLRIAAAALLARKGERAEAMALLAGDAVPILAARRRLEARQPLPGEVATAAAGVAEFLTRIAVDLNGQEVPQLALSFARLATFLAPGNSETWLVTGELLGGGGRHEAALAALANIRPDDPFAAMAADRRIALLLESGRREAALAEANAAVAAAPASVEHRTRLGDLLSQMERHAEAAAAYGEALELRRGESESSQPEWALWLLRGAALTQAGDWPEAKAALGKAYELAPQQAVVLNYLGYSQLERRENLPEAERLIREASKLQPDDFAITDSLGWAHYVRGDFARAIELLERAAQGQPADPAINEHLGDAYYSAGRRFEARYAWEAALVYADGKAADRLRAKIAAGLRPEFAAP